MQRSLAELLRRGVKDPRVGNVTITAVIAGARPHGRARSFPAVRPARTRPMRVLAGLRSAAGFLRGERGARAASCGTRRGSSSSSTPSSSARSSSPADRSRGEVPTRSRGATAVESQRSRRGTLSGPAAAGSPLAGYCCSTSRRAVLERGAAARAAAGAAASRPGTPAASIRSRAACCRSAWGRRPGSPGSCSWAARPIGSSCGSASAPRTGDAEGEIVERCAGAGADRAPAGRAGAGAVSGARSSRCRRCTRRSSATAAAVSARARAA